ncbi:SdrD B-like domain-containing protein [Kordia sp.]|uniref:SdrD B-like domain-containing protein n=1 Tax=Kordia sp. TaxID=1965332 RepID=UPI003B58E61D
MPSSENVVENEIMTTGDNSIIISAGKRIYTLDMNTYQATLLATSPYVNEINSIASDATSGWIFYVSNHISRYNWTIYGYNVYTNTHKNFGSVRHFFTSTGHAYSSRGLASGGATFYNGKLYFAMEYPVYCSYYYRGTGRSSGRGTSSTGQNLKDELSDNQRAAGTGSAGSTMITRNASRRSASTGRIANREEEQDTRDNGRDGNGESPEDFVIVEAEEANQMNENVSDYLPEEELPAETEATSDDNLQRRSSRSARGSKGGGTQKSSYYHSTYNNNMYLLEISFNGLSDATGQTTSVANGTPVYDNWWYSSFLYKGELGDIVVGDNGQMYAATSYQVQAYNFNNNTYDWANNEDVYAQMAKDKHSNLQLLKNKITYTTYYYHGCPQNVYTTKSYVQSYTAPSHLRTYNNIQLGSLNEITGMDPHDVGKITDASDYVNLTPPVSYKVKGTVYDDNDEDGNFNSSVDGRLQGVLVTLYADNNADGLLDSGDTVIDTRNTSSTGWYSFPDVQVAKTIVAVTKPADTNTATFTSTSPEVVAITGSTDDVRVNFGINEQQILVNYDVFGTVFDDNNENATLENGEAGLNNVTLTLYNDTNADGVLDTNDTVIATTTSGVDGTYSFLHVCIQNTIVAVTVPTNTGTFTYTLTTPGTQAINEINNDVTGLDFGINEEQVVDYTISGNVYDDNDESGAQDAGEDDLDAITVTLYADNNANGTVDAGDTAISTAVTGVDGAYSFANVTAPNTVVAVTVPSNTVDFTYTLTTAGEVNTSSTTTDVPNVNFGINEVQVIDYNISGTVFDDDNANGVNDTEAGLDAVTVTLYTDNNNDGTVDGGDTVITSTTTGVDGTYSFANVTVPNTLVGVTVPSNTANFTYTLTTAGAINTSSTITDITGADFGVNQEQIINYNISGTVFDDDNENGTNDSEAGLNGITVTLYADNNADGNLDVADTNIGSTTTGVNGAYSFSSITTENVLAVVSTPGNTATFTYVLTTSNTQAVSSLITDVNGLDFGINENLVIDYNISGTVFDDDNANGTNDTEAGLDAITVKLYADNDESGTLTAGDGLLEITSTDVNGDYSFTNVSTQFTLVGVEVPTNTPDFTYTATTATKLGVSSTISDVNDQDFGINKVQIINYNISGTVFDDDNENGSIDSTEAGRLENVTLTLYADNDNNGRVGSGDTVISTTTSAIDGTYSFSAVTVQNTLVEVTVPADTATFTYVLTTSTAINTSSTITNVTGADFGVNQEEVILYNISGTVFDDDNGSGVRDMGEGFIGAATLTLYADNNNDGILDSGDTVIGTTTTSTMSGNYNFTGVTVGNTIVSVAVPGNTATFTYALTTAGDQAVSSVNTDVNNVNFGIDRVQVINYNISGTVFDDDNENGSIDSTEAGRLANITLTLYADNDNNGRVGSGDTIITTTTSAMDGTYGFAGVTVENTIVVVSVPADDSNFSYTLTTSERKVTSSTIIDVNGADFGINQQSTSYTISGNVFNDLNSDGDSTSDRGLSGVTIRLFADANQNGRVDRGEAVIATTTSDRNGNYQFPGLTEIDVIVQVIVPANTTQFQYTATTAVNVPVNSGANTTVDFGINRALVILYDISGDVWDDDNADQMKDTNELRLEGIGMTLYNDVNANGVIDGSDIALSTITTNQNGFYEFTNINLANVIIAPTVPSNGTLTTPGIRAISSVNTNVIDVDFGIDIASTLYQVTGVVFDDDNENGIADPGEGSLDGLAVEIYADTDGSGTFDANLDALVAFTQTSNGGFGFLDPNYLVDNVPQGLVFVVVVIPDDIPPFESWTATFDPDTGTANPDGVFPTIMTASLTGVNFGVNYRNLNSTARMAEAESTMITNESAPEDVSERLRLYPNPTVNNFVVGNADQFDGEVTVEIYNDRGYRVMSTTESPIRGEIKVDVQRLSPGMYYVKLASRNAVANKKIIKK